MPPLPPARRQVAPTPATQKRLTTRHRRFLRLYCHPSGHPSQGLSQAEFDTLPVKCQDALRWVVTTATHLPEATRKALEAYYGSGYRPSWIPPREDIPEPMASVGAYEDDIQHAADLLEAPNGDLATLLNAMPGLSDSAITTRLLTSYEQPELKPGEKIRLEVGRLLLQMKGHLKEQKQQVTQGTQIILHLDTPRPSQTTEPEPLTLDLLPKRPQT